jgi:hypothetical protein
LQYFDGLVEAEGEDMLSSRPGCEKCGFGSRGTNRQRPEWLAELLA